MSESIDEELEKLAEAAARNAKRMAIFKPLLKFSNLYGGIIVYSQRKQMAVH